MTLIVSILRQDFAAQVSDRRLSGGADVDDEWNKAALLICQDARCCLGFTGVAGIGTFDTRRFLFDTLIGVAPPDYSLRGILLRASVALTDRWHELRSDFGAADLRLTVCMTGFEYRSEHPTPLVAVISNFESGTSRGGAVRDDFRPDLKLAAEPTEPSGFVSTYGDNRRFSDEYFLSIARLVEGTTPAESVVSRTVGLVQKAKGGSVGEQCSSILVPREIERVVDVRYHSRAATQQVAGVATVVALRDPPLVRVMNAPTISADSEAAAVPRVARNAQCPCGSGRKYKRCHGGPTAGLRLAYGIIERPDQAGKQTGPQLTTNLIHKPSEGSEEGSGFSVDLT